MNIGLGIGIPFNRSQIWLSLFSPSSLFAAGEQGVWYDPSDVQTLFQDAAGTTPVTTVEQPVGLVLDKSKGLVLGPELVTNGDFSSDTWWLKGPNCTISGGAGNASSAASGSGWYKTGLLTVNAYYEITFTVVSCSVGAFRVGFMSARYSGAYSTPGTYTVRLAADSTSFIVETVGTTTGYIDNVSVKQVTGNHAYQSTSTKRPVLSARVNLLERTENFADAVWSKSAGVGVSTNTINAPNGTLTADQISITATQDNYLAQTVAGVNATARQWVFSFYAKCLSGTKTVPIFIDDGNGAFALNPATTTVTVTDTWNLFTLQGTQATTSLMTVRCGFGGFNSWKTGDSIYIWGADLRPVNTGVNLSSYQRVNTATDYDTVGFPTYLKFDGIDDALQTNSIDFTATDKMTVFAGVRKLRDATERVLAELSTTYGIPGTFAAFAPEGGTEQRAFAFGLNGSQTTYFQATSDLSPTTKVLSCYYDIAGATNVTEIFPRINGVVPVLTGQGSADAGTGNFGNYPLYIGARTGTSLFFNGHLYNLIVRGAQSTAAQIESTEKWVNGKTAAF